jgi:hypothetical protein
VRASGGLAVALVLVAACASGTDTGDRFRAEQEGFSLVLPDDWSSRSDRGAWIFASRSQPRRTLAVRSLLIADRATGLHALDATKTVVEALPEVRMTATRSLETPLRGVSYQLTFVPPRSAERYARTHVVLLGKRRVFHVIETAPVAAAGDGSTIHAVVASFREEV